jgi:tetratricopeptide (TPR) repeat protein
MNQPPGRPPGPPYGGAPGQLPSGYPPQQPAYSPQQPGHPPQQPGYPPQQPGYPPQQPAQGYAPPSQQVPQQGQGYAPQQQPGYAPGQQPGYAPGQQPGYAPGQQPGYPPPQGYAPQQQGYPQQGGYGAPAPGLPLRVQAQAKKGGLSGGCVVAIAAVVAIPVLLMIMGFLAFRARKVASTSTSASASAASAGDGAPGRRLSPAEQKAMVDSAMGEYAKADRDCLKVLKGLSLGLPDEVTAETEPAFVAAAECAQHLRYWSIMREATVRILKFDKDFARPAYLPLAEIGMGQYDKALTDLDALLAKSPKDPDLVLTKGVAQCKRMRWPECASTMDDTLKLAHAAGAGKAAVEAAAALHRADAALHLGKLEEAQRFVDQAAKGGADADEVSGIRKDLVRARSAKVVIDEFHQPEIPLGIYHLYGYVKDAGAPGGLYLYNIGPADRQFRVEAEVAGVTTRLTKNVTVLKGKSELIPLVPPLKPDFSVAAQRGTTSTQLAYKIVALDAAGEKVVYEDSHPVKILPRDSLLLSLRVDEVVTRPFDDYIGAWVTPNAKAVEAFITAAKKRAPNQAFAGPQTATVPQVEALFDELKERGVSYVMDPEATSVSGHAQRTRLPSEVLASSNAQCLEGAILFATLMENIGLDPFIILIPGHAFAGWLSAKDGMPDGTPLYVETPMVHSARFADAMSYGAAEVKKQKDLKHFESGLARYVVIKTLRKNGVAPQPGE